MGTDAATPPGPDPLRPAPPGSAPIPVGFHLAADEELAVLAEGRVFIGGSPPRVLRLRPRAADMARRWLAGDPVENRRADRVVARRLVRAGMLHPRPEPVSPGVLVTVVVPVRDRPESLARLLASLGPSRCIVVDDASLGGAEIEKVAREAGGEYVRLDQHRGPGAARNTGLSRVRTPLVAFVDSDCVVPPGWLDGLVGHFDDPQVALVAPRVVTRPGPSPLARYEAARSPLDLGTREARVAPAARVAYVPTAAVVLRRAAVPGRCFDERLEVGEDVDLVWRLVEARWDARYVPSVEVEHTSELRPSAWAARRARYGSSAGPLAVRHGDAVAPARFSPATAALWALVAARHPLPALGVAVASTGSVAARLRGVVDDPVTLAIRITGRGVAKSAVPTVAGLTRAWGPLLVLSLLFRRLGRARLVVLGALAVTATRDWGTRPAGVARLDYVRMRLVDDMAYGAGVWWGCWRARTVRPLIPALVTARRVRGPGTRRPTTTDSGLGP